MRGQDTAMETSDRQGHLQDDEEVDSASSVVVHSAPSCTIAPLAQQEVQSEALHETCSSHEQVSPPLSRQEGGEHDDEASGKFDTNESVEALNQSHKPSEAPRNGSSLTDLENDVIRKAKCSSSSSMVPRTLHDFEEAIRAMYPQRGTRSTSSGPGAYPISAPPTLRHPRPSGLPSLPSGRSQPRPHLTPYVVEARLVMEESSDEETEFEMDDYVTNGKATRPQSRELVGVEMALPSSKLLVEATPVHLPNVWKKRCAWLTIVLVVVAAVGAAIGITLGITEAPPTTKATNSSDAKPNRTSIPTVTSSDPIGDFRSFLSDSTLQALEVERSPQSRAYSWAVAHPPHNGNVIVRMVQRFAMATLYYATDGADWARSGGWLDDSVHECDWYFSSSMEYSCLEGTDTISRIGLSDNSLKGTLPPELGLLSSIESLVFSSNDELVGPVPDFVSDMKSLSVVYLSSNMLSGTLPKLPPSTTSVFIWSNQISGGLPDEYKQLTKLKDFVARDNLLSGGFSEDVWGSWKLLESMDVSENNLQGTISSGIGLLTHLTSLGLMENEFSGPLPTELGLLTAMRDMFIGHNHFTSTLPTELATMASLMFIDFYGNELNGTIPRKLFQLSGLKELCLETNLLSGPIPTEVASLSKLQKLSLFGNVLSGTIPSQIAALKELQVLHLESNALTGPIPRQLGDLTSISEIHLAANQLNQTIPTDLGNLVGIVELDLSHNDLTGTIPTELGYLTAMAALHLHENRITGTVPFELCTLIQLNSIAVTVDCDNVNCSCGCACGSNATGVVRYLL